MVFVDRANDVTLSPQGASAAPALLSAARYLPGQSFEQAANNNRIYQGNGLICQRNMCAAMYNCQDVTQCARQPGWKQISDFCGPVGTPALSMDGGWWRLEPANERQILTANTEQSTGWQVLPTPYNTVGMY